MSEPKTTTPRLVWPTKPATVERIALPFQVVETINESRATREAQSGSLFGTSVGAHSDGWKNKLIWGENKLVMGSLLKEFAGRVKLIYIDPPFATGDDFSIQVRVGDSSLVKQPSILEEHAYRDTWGAGYDSYLSMMYERFVLMHELLADDGSIYVHCDWRVSSYLRLILDEIFGAANFQNEVVWWYRKWSKSTKHFLRNHDVLLFYTKADKHLFNVLRVPLAASTLKRFGGRRQDFADETRTRKVATDEESEGGFRPDVWDHNALPAHAAERLNYPTQKPEALLETVIQASSNPGDLVADFFIGSGTSAAVAEKLGRRWIACDLGRFAIHTTRKRLLGVQDSHPFEILNLGRYERQHWQHVTTGDEVNAYVGFILALYDAQGMDGYKHLHGKKADRFVHVGAVDAPVTVDEMEQVMDEVADNDFRSVDVLGWEWEMGLHDVVAEVARRRGLDVGCWQIPREVMRAEAGDEVRFFELAYLELQVDRNGQSVRVQLRDFVIPSDELIPDSLRAEVTHWSDYIDYWSIDFNFRDDTFHNEWQSYRTRDEPKLGVDSDWHDYESPGRYLIVVKVIDIFGNDTTKLAEVLVK